MSGKSTHDSKKLSLGQFVWMGFNYTVGIGFIGNLATFSNFKNAKNDWNYESVGLHVFWIFLLIGLVASVCALAFAKLSKIHRSDNNGGAYLFARTAFGRFTGFLIAFIQYIILPFLITNQIFNLMKGFFSGEYAGNTGMNLEDAMDKIGAKSWAPLTLDVMGIIVYFVFALIIFGGMKFFKRMTSISGYVKWATSGILILGGIVMASMHGGDNYSDWVHSNIGDSPTKDGIHNSGDFKLTFNAFTKTFTSAFFFFAGFETFSTAGKNIENPEKNLGKGIMIIMLTSTIFYILTMLIFFGAMSPKSENGGFIQNMNMGFWTVDGIKSIRWVSYAGMGIMIFSQFALKANVSMQNALYGGTMIQPMSIEGYLPEKYNELNKDDLPIKASKLNFYITFFVLLLWLIIPDIIQGITKTDAIFSVAQLTEASSAITLFVYMVSIFALLKYAVTKKVYLNIAEWIMYSTTLVVIMVLFVYHYYSVIDNTVKGINGIQADSNDKDALSKLIGSAVELAFITFVVIFGVIWYFSYYASKLKSRLNLSGSLTHIYRRSVLNAVEGTNTIDSSIHESVTKEQIDFEKLESAAKGFDTKGTNLQKLLDSEFVLLKNAMYTIDYKYVSEYKKLRQEAKAAKAAEKLSKWALYSNQKADYKLLLKQENQRISELSVEDKKAYLLNEKMKSKPWLKFDSEKIKNDLVIEKEAYKEFVKNKKLEWKQIRLDKKAKKI